jgi:hypothetical protein
MTLKYPAIPHPTDHPKSLWESSMAQKQTLEILLGQKGSKTAAAVTWQDLVNLGLVLPNDVGSSNITAAPSPYPAQAIPVLPPVLQGYLGGLALSNDGGSPNSVLDIAAGVCADSTAATYISLGAFTKSTAGAWAAGTGSNGMGTGLTIANSTWYHVFAIMKAGVSDVYFDTSVSAANAPSGTTAFRRIGSFKTDGSAHILAFTQVYMAFYWATQVQDVNVTNLISASGTLLTLGSVPPGVKVQPLVRALTNATPAAPIFLTSADETDVATTTTYSTTPGFDFSTNSQVFAGYLTTNVVQQIRARGASGTTNDLAIYTRGWVDALGRF